MTEAYAKAGLLNVPRPNDDDDDDDIPPLDYPIGAVWPPPNRGRVGPRIPVGMNSADQIYNPRTGRWIRNTNANRQRILGQGDDLIFRWAEDIPEPAPPRIQRRQPGDRYVIAGLVMEVVRDVRPWHA